MCKNISKIYQKIIHKNLSKKYIKKIIHKKYQK